jgi:hypothetical protein
MTDLGRSCTSPVSLKRLTKRYPVEAIHNVAVAFAHTTTRNDISILRSDTRQSQTTATISNDNVAISTLKCRLLKYDISRCRFALSSVVSHCRYVTLRCRDVTSRCRVLQMRRQHYQTTRNNLKRRSTMRSDIFLMSYRMSRVAVLI